MPKQSAGILLYRRRDLGNGTESGSEISLEVFLAHPGGPFWAKKDAGAWTIPKGEYEDGEEPLAAALREFEEETGFGQIAAMAREKFVALGSVRQASGKIVKAWAAELDFELDAAKVKSNTCEIEWPPRSGRRIVVPEVDRAAWFAMGEARERIFAAQVEFLERLVALLDGKS
jgi:predicted NUDIX family NTP pyrophosphohydrolase